MIAENAFLSSVRMPLSITTGGNRFRPHSRATPVVALIRRNGEFFQYDGIGSARTFTNASGAVTAAATYDGFGNTVATSGSTSSPYQFGATSGYRNDGDAGIMQVGARYYDPATGSFLTRDTDLSQLAYVYCGDDPVNEIDPSGHWKMSRRIQINLQWGGFGVVIIGGITAIVAISQPELAIPAIVVGLVGGGISLAGGCPEPVNESGTWIQNHFPLPPTPPGAMPPGIYP